MLLDKKNNRKNLLNHIVEKRTTQSEIHETRVVVDMEFAAPEMHLINQPTLSN